MTKPNEIAALYRYYYAVSGDALAAATLVEQHLEREEWLAEYDDENSNPGGRGL